MRASGIGAGERQLASIQTAGRTYRNLSEPRFETVTANDVAVPMRDGVSLLADIHRPDRRERVPALVAISPYPRQMQHLGLPVGFIEGGQSDFFVPRGYAHVIVNCRGTGGSGGTYALTGEAEHRDLYDLIEWVAAQPWCDGNVGMIGVSYFAIEQFNAAIQQPPHLKAIFPWSGTVDWYREVFWHGGIHTGGFATKYFAAIGMANRRNPDFYRGWFFTLLNKLIRLPALHRRLAKPHANPVATLGRALRFPYPPHPWDDIYFAVAEEHQLYDDFWRVRDMTDRLSEIRIPIYLGADWDNVSVHLQTPFLALERLAAGVPHRVTMAPRGTLQWPWESLHIEALAWFDHWLKGNDTGIMEGQPIRYYVEGAEEWRDADTWPLPDTRYDALHLCADGSLSADERKVGSRDYLYLPKSLGRSRNANPAPLPSRLGWETAPFAEPVEIIGHSRLRLLAASSAIDTDWMAKLKDVAPDGSARDLTMGWLRASHRALDPARSKPYRPEHPHDRVEALVPHQETWFEIAILPTAHRFRTGHRLRLLLASADADGFAMQGMTHLELAMPARNRIFSASQLIVPIPPK
ncbi:MAG TPA: CocE/NonD family hydrolase [Stellaceae bacterium]|nr:CocE/NonD family hydrolase [Stellaceae bacterium]